MASCHGDYIKVLCSSGAFKKRQLKHRREQEHPIWLVSQDQLWGVYCEVGVGAIGEGGEALRSQVPLVPHAASRRAVC